MSTIKVLLVDDHDLVRTGLRMLLEAQSDIEVVGEANSGVTAVSKIKTCQPDVILMDLQMPDMNGIEATREIKAIAPEMAVLALTVYEDDQYFFEMLKAGASGYVPKRAAPDELVTAVHTVSRGDVFLYPSLAARLVQDFVKRQTAETAVSVPGSLTPREQEVLVQIAEGLTNPEIAKKLDISVKTVDRHRENMLRKLNMNSRIQLVKYAIRKGLIELDD